MIVLEEFIDLGHCRVIHLFESADLGFKEFSLVAANLVLVDDVYCAYQPGFGMDGFT